jgi:hypothetical protein
LPWCAAEDIRATVNRTGLGDKCWAGLSISSGMKTAPRDGPLGNDW